MPLQPHEIASVWSALSRSLAAVAELPRTEVFSLLIAALVVLAFLWAAWRGFAEERARTRSEAAWHGYRAEVDRQGDPGNLLQGQPCSSVS